MDIEKNIARFEAEFGKVRREGAEKMMKYIRTSDFYSAPASTRFHLSCPGGLLLHSLNVLDALRSILRQSESGDWEYVVAGKVVDAISDEGLIIITLLHDICKTHFYSIEYRNVKNKETGVWEKAPYYSINDAMPLGHGDKSAMIIKEYMELTTQEMYAIWWHMGFAGTTDALTLGQAIDRHPIIWALHTADMMANHFMEAEDDNQSLFLSEEEKVPKGVSENDPNQ